jgi:hypothetical protein
LVSIDLGINLLVLACGAAASVRIYYEVIRSNDFLDWRLRHVTVPVGISFFPKEIGQSPRASVFSL